MRRRILVPFAIVAPLILVSCARVGPMTLQLAPNQATSGGNLAARDAAIAPEGPATKLDISVQGELPTYADRILAWSISTRRGLGEELGKLATAFNINGTVDKPSDDNWLVVDPVTGATASLWSTTQTGGWWNYSAVSADASSGSGTATGECTPDGSCTTVDPVKPVEPTKPTHLITAGEAVRRTNQYLRRADMVPLNYDLTAVQGEWSTEVSGPLILGGVRTNLLISFSYGEDGVLTYAGGPMISIAMAGRYYVVQPSEAVDRLNDARYVVYGAASVTARDATATSDGSGADAKIVITGARLTLMEARLANGTHMLLPAYTYSNEQGDIGTVLAIRDDYLAFSGTDPGVTTDTNVADPGGGGSPGSIAPLDNATAKQLVGLTEEEAMKVCAEKGWTYRVAMRDGHALMLTADYSISRVNVTVVDDHVTAVAIG